MAEKDVDRFHLTRHVYVVSIAEVLLFGFGADHEGVVKDLGSGVVVLAVYIVVRQGGAHIVQQVLEAGLISKPERLGDDGGAVILI